MKNLLLTSILLLSFLFSFSQSEKKYTVTEIEKDYNKFLVLKYNDKIIPIEIIYNTENYLYFLNKNATFYLKEKLKIYKIEKSKIVFVNLKIPIDKVDNYDNNDALLKFSSQSQLALILQILAPSLLFLKSDVGIYGALGVSLLATIIHIDAFRHLKTFAKIDKAIEYPY